MNDIFSDLKQHLDDLRLERDALRERLSQLEDARQARTATREDDQRLIELLEQEEHVSGMTLEQRFENHCHGEAATWQKVLPRLARVEELIDRLALRVERGEGKR